MGQKSEDRDPETRLLLYMIGWRKGVVAAAVTKENLANEDFRDGYEEGRAAKTVAYGAACLIYGATLNPLRADLADHTPGPA
jgi:hypothetical protein